MKFSKAFCIVLSILIGALYLPLTAFADVQTSTLVDSGIDYSESLNTINNPGAGYTTTLWYTCAPGNTPVKNPSGNLVLMFVNIGAFSSGFNGTTDEDENYTEGVDYDLDDEFFAGLRGTLQNCRNNGCTVAIRFRYDDKGKTNPEPASFDKVLEHISQIKENGVLEDYKDILMFVETGFVGAWGEQHSGKYTSLEYKAQLVDAMLDLVPDDIPITVRTPNTFAKWAGISVSELDTWVSEPGSDAARIGLYNDGYMGSNSDLGTYSNREKETTWLGNQTFTSYYGGEFSGNLTWAQKYDTYLPENAIPEMYKTHLSYINSNIYNLYNDYTYDEQYDVGNADNSAYYGQTVYKFIRDHLGYRFVLRDSQLSSSAEQGGTLELKLNVENTGFANPIRQQNAEIILEKDGNYVRTNVDIDSRQWLSCSTSSESLKLKIPASLDTGEWNVYLRLSVGNQGISDGYLRSVQFANNDVWNASLGANLLGSFTVTSSDDTSLLTDNSFYQLDSSSAASDGSVYTVNDIVILDGVKSSDAEWTYSILVAENGSNKLYITNDDKYLYICAEIIQSAASPVYNLQIKNADENNKFYWMYYMSNGFVYFNNGSYDGCECKKSGNYVEFKIPFGSVMNINPGVTLSSVRVSIQDSSDSWVNVGEVSSGEYTVSDNFYIYSVSRTVCIGAHEDFSMTVESSLDNASYQWLHDGKIISNANDKSFTITDADESCKGVYSVRVTSESGCTREVEICNVAQVYDVKIVGDVNADGLFNSADLVMMQNWLLGNGSLTDSSAGELCGDDTVDIFDFIAMRQALA